MQDSERIVGIQPLLEALENEKQVNKVYIQRGKQSEASTELMKRMRREDIPYSMVPREKLNRMYSGNHQGVVAFMSPVEFQDLNEIVSAAYERAEVPLILILDRVNDVRNFGAIIRSAECLGVHATVIANKGSAPINDEAIKASSGALLHANVCREKNLQDTADKLRGFGLKIYGASEKAELEVADARLTEPMALIMGAEGRGISKELYAKCDDGVKIPMSGKIESLNVSVATGICLYECFKQRNAQL